MYGVSIELGSRYRKKVLFMAVLNKIFWDINWGESSQGWTQRICIAFFSMFLNLSLVAKISQAWRKKWTHDLDIVRKVIWVLLGGRREEVCALLSFPFSLSQSYFPSMVGCLAVKCGAWAVSWAFLKCGKLWLAWPTNRQGEQSSISPHFL